MTSEFECVAPFATPVLACDVGGTEALNAELTRLLVTESESCAGVKRPEFGQSWQSEPDLACRGEPAFRAMTRMLFHQIGAAVRAMATSQGFSELPDFDLELFAWATVMRDHDYIAHHDHEESVFSAVYYADAGDSDQRLHPSSGILAFVGPTRVSSPVLGIDLFPSTFEVLPRSGRLFLFPGYLHHYVHTYRGRRPRVAISTAVDVRLHQSSGTALGYPSRPRPLPAR